MAQSPEIVPELEKKVNTVNSHCKSLNIRPTTRVYAFNCTSLDLVWK